MSHPDPLFDPDNAYEDDDMVVEHDPSDALLAEYLYDNKEDIYMDNDTNYDDYNDFHDGVDGDDRTNDYWAGDDLNYDDSMDGDHDSATTSCGWGTDEDYGYFGEDVDYREDFHSDDGYGCYGEDY
jgi:hypothetical protein